MPWKYQTVPGTVKEANGDPLRIIDVAAWVEVDTQESQDGNTRETVYQHTAAVQPPVTMRVGQYKNPKALNGLGQTNFSVRRLGSIIPVDADGVQNGPAFVFPVTIAFSVPGVAGIPPHLGNSPTAETQIAQTITETASAFVGMCGADGSVAVTRELSNLASGLTMTVLANANATV